MGFYYKKNRLSAVFSCAKRDDCGLLARRFPLAAAPAVRAR